MNPTSSFFELVGIITCGAVLGFIVYSCAVWIQEKIENLKFAHKQKHRFDKPPIANCYCVDCKSHGDKGWGSGPCPFSPKGYYTPDNGFCYLGDPKERK